MRSANLHPIFKISINLVTQNKWFIIENPIQKWMMTGGTPISDTSPVSRRPRPRIAVLASLGHSRLDLADLGAHASGHHAGQTGAVGDRRAGEEQVLLLLGGAWEGLGPGAWGVSMLVQVAG